jgi:ABC-type lipoprotein release transport system permease subunit
VIAGVAIVVGVPLGAVAGQWSWRVFANQLGVVPRGAIPLVALGVVVLGALVLANLTAALPARNAGRTRPTVALHAE